MEGATQVKRSDLGAENVTIIFRGGPRDGLAKESKRVIRAILSAIEESTNYNALDPNQKKHIRSIVLDNVNNLKRISLLYIDFQSKQ